jgi:hypothetical protein
LANEDWVLLRGCATGVSGQIYTGLHGPYLAGRYIHARF